MFRRGRLVLRIYAIGLAQVAALAATLAIAREWGRRPRPPHLAQIRFLIEEIASHADGPAALDVRLRELRQRTGMEVQLQDRSGHAIAGTAATHRRGPFATEWSGGKAFVWMPRPPPPEGGGPLFAIAAVLVPVGISAGLSAACV